MNKKDKYLLNVSGEPYRTVTGNPVRLDLLSSDPELTKYLESKQIINAIEDSAYLGDAPARASAMVDTIRATIKG